MTQLLTVNSKIKCPHGGTVKAVAFNRAKAGGAIVVTMKDLFTVAGCPFQLPTVPPTPSPCIMVRWLTPTRVLCMAPVLNRLSVGLCFSANGLPQGPAIVVQTQMKARTS